MAHGKCCDEIREGAPFALIWVPKGGQFFKRTISFFLITLLLFNYSCLCFLPTPYPTPAKPTSLPCFHPPPWFCLCALYGSSWKPFKRTISNLTLQLLPCSQRKQNDLHVWWVLEEEHKMQVSVPSVFCFYISPACRVHIVSAHCLKKIRNETLRRDLPIPSSGSVHMSFYIRKLLRLHMKAAFWNQSLLAI